MFLPGQAVTMKDANFELTEETQFVYSVPPDKVEVSQEVVEERMSDAKKRSIEKEGTLVSFNDSEISKIQSGSSIFFIRDTRVRF
jgi:hypothetical protein